MGHWVNADAVRAGGTNFSNVQSVNFNDAGETLTSIGDNDLYSRNVHNTNIKHLMTIVTQNLDHGAVTGDRGDASFVAKGKGGSIDITWSCDNGEIQSADNTVSRANGEATIIYEGVSPDGVTSPFSSA